MQNISNPSFQPHKFSLESEEEEDLFSDLNTDENDDKFPQMYSGQNAIEIKVLKEEFQATDQELIAYLPEKMLISGNKQEHLDSQLFPYLASKSADAVKEGFPTVINIKHMDPKISPEKAERIQATNRFVQIIRGGSNTLTGETEENENNPKNEEIEIAFHPEYSDKIKNRIKNGEIEEINVYDDDRNLQQKITVDEQGNLPVKIRGMTVVEIEFVSRHIFALINLGYALRLEEMREKERKEKIQGEQNVQVQLINFNINKKINHRVVIVSLLNNKPHKIKILVVFKLNINVSFDDKRDKKLEKEIYEKLMVEIIKRDVLQGEIKQDTIKELIKKTDLIVQNILNEAFENVTCKITLKGQLK